MPTVTVSRSGQLWQPGTALDEPDALVRIPPPTAPTLRVSAPPERTDTPARQEELRAQEVRWVCEWWPPT